MSSTDAQFAEVLDTFAANKWAITFTTGHVARLEHYKQVGGYVRRTKSITNKIDARASVELAPNGKWELRLANWFTTTSEAKSDYLKAVRQLKKAGVPVFSNL
ncbi:hypothetical protein [Nocardia carnea]|uniref:hypothetical protein n=1 Tax=Nocardia carnea TaxID=37328 RepID=UPI0024540C37|nr:hypothetical protein [Nocardia carnea]